MSHKKSLIELTVIDGGYCVGCGACAAVSDSPFVMELSDRYTPVRVTGETVSDTLEFVCPFSNTATNENELARKLFPVASEHQMLGRHLGVYAGFSENAEDRSGGSSGGLTTWFLRTLLEQDVVDAVVHVKPQHTTEEDRRLFAYGISRSTLELRMGAKSHYYPVEISEVIKLIRSTPGRYAFVGIPCVVKAIRLLAANDKIIANRIRFIVGIFCGHMKSSAFSEALGWEAGIPPGRLRAIDFRHKLPNRSASDYACLVNGTKSDGENMSLVLPMRDTMIFDWGIGWFRLPSCDYCDDVVAETADISFGDAWLSQYTADWNGTNIVICRDRRLEKVLDEAPASEISLERINPDSAALSQSSGFLHRREGLSYRLWLKQKGHLWAPKKRVPASNRHLSLQRKLVYRFRMILSAQSHERFRKARIAGDFSSFRTPMMPLVFAYKLLNIGGFVERRFHAIVHKLRKRLRW